MSETTMRYCSTGEVHLDFHGTTYVTIMYVLKNYGEAALEEIFRSTAHDVYRSIHTKLKAGDPSELLEFWRYYLKREEGDFAIAETPDGAVLELKSCPAARHLPKLGLQYDPEFCRATDRLNRWLCDGSDYEIVTEKTGQCSCRQTLRRRKEI